MGFPEIFLIAVGLSMDAFAVALGAGAAGQIGGNRATFRISFHFGLFQFLMPVIGWLLGQSITQVITAIDHWIAFALLLVIGLRMIYSGFHSEKSKYYSDPSRGLNLIMLSIATSIDALVVGFSLAMLRISIWYPCIIIGTVTAFLSLTGVLLGRYFGERFGKYMKIMGGGILIFIGARILISDLVL
jgi:putative Mn2+ efflux pump MntP